VVETLVPCTVDQNFKSLPVKTELKSRRSHRELSWPRATLSISVARIMQKSHHDSAL